MSRKLGRTTEDIAPPSTADSQPKPMRIGLVVLWASVDPHRVGEWFPLSTDRETSFGRETTQLLRQRPGANDATAPVDNGYLSRDHLVLSVIDETEVHVRSRGKRPLRWRGASFEEIHVTEGEIFGIDGLYSFLVTSRPVTLPGFAKKLSTFGEADEHGITGESLAIWKLREQIVFVGGRAAHVLVTGASGSGKELVARAIHEESPRRSKAIVARSAATFPSGIIDAELFGNLANYPNPGTPERPGLIGQADGSTLFLDEIGELPEELQARLLRVLDEHGEYQRLGEAKIRRSDLRFVGATNRPESAIKEDLLARMPLRIHVPGLDARRDDIPLVARQLLLRKARTDALVRERFIADGNPRLSQSFVEAIAQHEYTTHVRELDQILWRAIATSPTRTLDLTPEVAALVRMPQRPVEIDAAAVKRALEKHGGVREKAWRELGLPSRHALGRLMKRFGLE